MIENVNSSSYATISFSDNIGIPIDKADAEKYYVLGPQNSHLKNNTFVSQIDRPIEKNVLPNTGIWIEPNMFYLIGFIIVLVISVLGTLHGDHHKMMTKGNRENYD
ncbi:hypothetical protein [Leuconostoc sp. C2]|uniref:hypothetical protein n=1 Tax=Leuconostoc sp. (strain C2) TaxID=979982 RepID=UPI0002175871|nr:hypothetical protein [Leuconostoc sp. C2]AEJ30747.1 hypothetical protein LGMK_03445 [Leuconostoc sp. C2]